MINESQIISLDCYGGCGSGFGYFIILGLVGFLIVLLALSIIFIEERRMKDNAITKRV